MLSQIIKATGIILLLLHLFACTSNNLAPVTPRSSYIQMHGGHYVRAGETLYSIARLHGWSSQELAKINNISPPYTIYVGQLIRFSPKVHIVKKDETLYSIAWQYSLSHQELAKWNNIQAPFIIYINQPLKLYPPVVVHTRNTTKPLPHSSKASTSSPQKRGPNKPVSREPNKLSSTKPNPPPRHSRESGNPINKRESGNPINKHESGPSKNKSAKSSPQVTWGGKQWHWPTKGKVIQTFSAKSSSRRGLDISGKPGQEIKAASSGKVVYSGSGLRGYGNLLIIKHNDIFLSAYAHNSKLLVQEGDNVSMGQKIALMGDTGTNKTKLHFEIRRYGKPVDPEKYLPKK